jgi:nucleoside-diphosphate-sugar epimerase
MSAPTPQPRRALITGATGFVGGHLLRHLETAGWEVAVLSRTAGKEATRIRTFPYAGHTTEVVGAVDSFRPVAIFHLASLFVEQHTVDQVEPLILSNVLLGTQILEAMRATGVKYLVNAGTSWQNSMGDCYSPVNLYAATKQAFEDLLLYYVENEGIRAVTLKLFDSYGPGDTRRKFLSLLLECCRSGRQLAISGGEQVIDLAHVDDICRAFLRAAELAADLFHAPNATYAVSGGQRRSLRAVAETFERAVGRSLPISWGVRAYRAREIMVPWTGPSVPGWQRSISLERGIRALIGAELHIKDRR